MFRIAVLDPAATFQWHAPMWEPITDLTVAAALIPEAQAEYPDFPVEVQQLVPNADGDSSTWTAVK